MRPEEFTALAEVDREHWWYSGKRDLARHWIARLAPLGAADLLVDIGAGTGQLLAEVGGDCRAVGIESDPNGLRIAGARRLPLINASIGHLPLRDGCAAVVTALDVIEH